VFSIQFPVRWSSDVLSLSKGSPLGRIETNH
jgi:hypothetical protein